MKLEMQYKNDVIVVPTRATTDFLPPDASYLYVLLAICRDTSILCDGEHMIKKIAKDCRLPVRVVKNAVSYWLETGVLTEETDNGESPLAASSRDAFPAQVGGGVTAGDGGGGESLCSHKDGTWNRKALPTYPPEEMARIISETDGLRATLDECARIAGKLFSEHECATLAALYDTYDLDCAYLMTVFMYCKKRGKTSVSYVVKTALGLYDDGIRTSEQLDIHIAERERVHDMEYKIRKLFGLGERALTKAEREYIETWTLVWCMPYEVIARAYEVTIKNIEKPRLNYTNKILSGWHDAGIRTLAAVNEAALAYKEAQASGKKGAKKAKKDEASRQASYDLDEFLSLAMKRSFEE